MKALILVLAVLLVGCDDYTEQIQAEVHYCGMVKMNYWPAYNSDINCDEVFKNE